MRPATAVVTGAAGFLGRRITELLCARGEAVRVLVRQPQPDLEALGATPIILDIRDASAVRSALRDADVVFHVAAKTGPWGPAAEFRAVNVSGTRNVLDAARAGGVRRLVFTSTPSVVGYASDVENGGPDLPYAAVHESAYSQSKAEAERLVLAASGTPLRTVAVRPHLVIGPGDRRMMPLVVQRAHLDAADALEVPEAACAGRAYFISNGEPVLLWEWLNRVLAALGVPPVTRSLPFRTARLAAVAVERIWGAFHLAGEPPITAFLAGALARSHWYDLAAARRDLGYHVRVSMEEATRRTLAWLADGHRPVAEIPERSR
jgi:nucleoside-diphosphate-sugar epimerase